MPEEHIFDSPTEDILIVFFNVFQATKALCIIFRNKNSKVPMNSFYVSVIIFLVIQLHYLVNFADIEYGIEEGLRTSSYIR